MKYSVTDKQRDNLIILRNYLDKNEQHIEKNNAFSMDLYCVNKSGEHLISPISHKCGTCFCALGYGPKAGIAPYDDDINWRIYLENHFIQSTYYKNYALTRWLFDADWDAIDNTVKGAVSRLDRFLVYGIDDIADLIDKVLSISYSIEHRLNTYRGMLRPPLISS